ncbi:aminoglycoside adenylyltransferase domain-containing protein [Chloroflexota bacterium]
MKVIPKNTHSPLRFDELPQGIQAVCNRLLGGLISALDDNLYGLYLYGAMVFPETRYIEDLDFHVIINQTLADSEKEAIRKLHNEISDEFSVSKDDLDGYYILLDDARKLTTPWHQVYPDILDESWPLHIAHMRAGYCITLYGPEPGTFLPEPVWRDLMKGLGSTLIHTVKNLDRHPAYCILNLCRILYSYTTGDVVVSKSSAAGWVQEHFPEWRELVDSTLRVYEKEEDSEDRDNIRSKIKEFHRFVTGKIKQSNRDK